MWTLAVEGWFVFSSRQVTDRDKPPSKLVGEPDGVAQMFVGLENKRTVQTAVREHGGVSCSFLIWAQSGPRVSMKGVQSSSRSWEWRSLVSGRKRGCVSSAGLTTGSHPISVATLSAWKFSRHRHLGVVVGGAGYSPAQAASTRRGARRIWGRNKLSHSLSDRCHDIAAQLLVFPRVLFLEAEADVLVHVGSPQTLDLLHDIQQDLFWASIAFVVVLHLSYIAAGDVGCAIDRKGDTVRHLLAPPVRVKSRVVPCFLAGIDMDPSLLVLRVHLSPYVILGIPHPTYPATNGTTEHAEAVGPFAASSSSSL